MKIAEMLVYLAARNFHAGVVQIFQRASLGISWINSGALDSKMRGSNRAPRNITFEDGTYFASIIQARTKWILKYGNLAQLVARYIC